MRILGLDGGIASIGWAIIELNGLSGKILAAGSRTFESPAQSSKMLIDVCFGAKEEQSVAVLSGWH
jgi:Holliday junction resolvasome RuvABC endonuclease subunit